MQVEATNRKVEAEQGDREVFLTAANSDSRPVAIGQPFPAGGGVDHRGDVLENYPAAGLFQWGQYSLCQLSLSGYMTWVEPAGTSHRTGIMRLLSSGIQIGS